MIVRCANGHEFDDNESWYCPACYAEASETIEARFERLFKDCWDGLF